MLKKLSIFAIAALTASAAPSCLTPSITHAQQTQQAKTLRMVMHSDLKILDQI